MKKTSFGIVALLGFSLAVPAFAEEPAANAPPSKSEPGKPGHAGGITGPRGQGYPAGPSAVGPNGVAKSGPHAQLSAEDLAKRTAEVKARMAERAEKVKARAKELREKAAKARASGDVKQAEQLERTAERLEKGPPTPNRGPAWKKAMQKRKLARLKPLWKQYGERLRSEEVRSEFKKHATRVARLERMRDLAKNHPKEPLREKLTERINGLIAKENARHRQTLRSLVDKKEQPSATSERADTSTATPATSSTAAPGQTTLGTVQSANPAAQTAEETK